MAYNKYPIPRVVSARRLDYMEQAISGGAGSGTLDQDLTDIGNLAPPDDDFIQRKTGRWTNRTPAQVAADLGVTAGGGGSFLSAYKFGVSD
jgi:hypothetical protein